MNEEHIDVLIVGAGISGIGAGYYLKNKCPSKSFKILESRNNLGGTWDLFKYPGIRSDSDMTTMGYRFKPWTGKNLVAGGGAITIGINDQGNTATIGTATTIAITNTDNITGANGVDGSADTALGQIAKSLGNVAAGMSALKGYQAVASASSANLKAAAARIQDTDYALETANLTKAAILNQSAMAMVAQANQAQQAILTVIQ